MVASLWHQLLGTKVRLLVRLPAGVLRGAIGCGLAEEEMHTTTCSWYEPIVVRGANHYSFVVQTYSGSRVDQ